MGNLFYQGGPLFMGILTILLLVIIAIAVYRFIRILKNDVEHATTFRQSLTQIKSVGLFTLVFGIFGQLLGLYQAFTAIESMGGSISPALLAGGLKVSTIPTLYGMIIFLLSYLIWFGLDYAAKSKNPV